MSKFYLLIILFLFNFLLIPKNIHATVSCGWECSGINAVCKPGGDEINELAPGCFCHEWCAGDGSKTSDVSPCQGSYVECKNQWSRITEGCCNPPLPTPTPTITPTPTPTPTSFSIPTSTPTSTPTPTTPIPTGTPTSTPTFTTPYYFQVFGGDIHALFSNPGPPVESFFPSGKVFLNDISSQPLSAGILSTLSSDYPSLNSQPLSSTNWLARSYKYSTTRTYDYSHFKTILTNTKPISGGSTLNGGFPGSTNGSVWEINGDLTVSSISSGLGVQIFLVSGSLNVNGNLTVGTNSDTYPVFIVLKDITIKPNVETIGGIFITSKNFDTGTGDKKLVLQNGSIIAPYPIGIQNIKLSRLYSASGEPAETFIYDPTYLIKLSKYLGVTTHLWQEVEPESP